jgi:glycine cleavage system aminomethyltransferase T
VTTSAASWLRSRQIGEQVGKVTSACHSPRLENNIGYAMLPAGLAEPLGQVLEVETPTGRYRGVTVRPRFFPVRTVTTGAARLSW